MSSISFYQDGGGPENPLAKLIFVFVIIVVLVTAFQYLPHLIDCCADYWAEIKGIFPPIPW